MGPMSKSITDFPPTNTTNMKYETSLAIAGIINSAFETGLNPAWFEVKSLNKDGFLDAAFAECELETPSKKPARADWSLVARMNANEDEEGDTPFVTVTAKSTLRKLKAYLKKEKSSYAKIRIMKYLFYINLLESGCSREEANNIRSDFDFDGVDDDCFAQIAVCGDVIYG